MASVANNFTAMTAFIKVVKAKTCGGCGYGGGCGVCGKCGGCSSKMCGGCKKTCGTSCKTACAAACGAKTCATGCKAAACGTGQRLRAMCVIRLCLHGTTRLYSSGVHIESKLLLTCSLTAASFTPTAKRIPTHPFCMKQPSTRNMLRHQDLFHCCVYREEGAVRLPQPRHYHSQCSPHDHVVPRTEDVPLH